MVRNYSPMKKMQMKDRKKHDRDHEEVRSLLFARLEEQESDAFFVTVHRADRKMVPEAEMYDFWLLRKNGMTDALPAEKIADYVRTVLPASDLAEYRGNLMVYPVPSRNIEEVRRKIEAFLRFLEEAGADAVLVHSTNTIWMEHMHLVYREMVTAIPDMQAIFPKARYYSYQHVCFARSIRSISDNSELFGVDRYLLDNLEHRYPRGEPVKVLGVYYLDEGMDLARTADRLYLHRNTAKYRLNKISTLLGVDVLDVTKSQFLIMALALERLYRSSRRTDPAA